ncbi:6161_t:CDS:1, partial [Acaulospora morrowiae]
HAEIAERESQNAAENNQNARDTFVMDSVRVPPSYNIDKMVL